MSPPREMVTNSIVPRIRAVLAAAEQTAAQVTEEAESEAGRRTREVLVAAEADGERIRREATRRVEEYLAASRRRIDAFATARIERITELTEGVIEAATSIQERFEQAAAVQREVHAMVEALGTVAQAVAREAAVAAPALPRAPVAPERSEGGPSWARTGPDGSVVGEATVHNGRAAKPPDAREGDLEEEDPGDGIELDLGTEDAFADSSAEGAPDTYEAALESLRAGSPVEARRAGPEDADEFDLRDAGEDDGESDREDDGEDDGESDPGDDHLAPA
jgi:hypothetical protein